MLWLDDSIVDSSRSRLSPTSQSRPFRQQRSWFMAASVPCVAMAAAARYACAGRSWDAPCVCSPPGTRHCGPHSFTPHGTRTVGWWRRLRVLGGRVYRYMWGMHKWRLPRGGGGASVRSRRGRGYASAQRMHRCPGHKVLLAGVNGPSFCSIAISARPRDPYSPAPCAHARMR